MDHFISGGSDADDRRSWERALSPRLDLMASSSSPEKMTEKDKLRQLAGQLATLTSAYDDGSMEPSVEDAGAEGKDPSLPAAAEEFRNGRSPRSQRVTLHVSPCNYLGQSNHGEEGRISIFDDSVGKKTN